MANKQIVNFNASTTKPAEGQGVKGTLYFITGEQKPYLCTDSSILVPMDGSVKNVVMDVNTKQLNVSMIGDTSINTEFITSEDVMGTDMVAREELVERVDDITKILTGDGDIPYFNKDLDYYKDDFVIYNGICYKFVYDHPNGDWTGNDVEMTSLMGAYKEILEMVKTYTGYEELPIFSERISYAVNDIVVHNKCLWRFTVAHSAGIWNGNDVEETSLVLEYLRLTRTSDIETVQIHVTKQDNIVSRVPCPSCNLTMSVNGVATQLETDEYGNVSTTVNDGIVYTISCNPIEGYSLPAAITRTAQLTNFYMSFNYINNAIAPIEYEYPYCTIFSSDLTQTDPALWAEVGFNKEPIGVVLKTPVLQKFELSFLIRFKDIITFDTNTNQYKKSIITKQWQTGFGLLDTTVVPTARNISEATNNMVVLNVDANIIDKAAGCNQNAPAAVYAHNEYLIINDVSYGNGYIGTGLQTVQMLINQNLISQCVNAVYGIGITFTDNNPPIWTNVQFDATGAWTTNGSSLKPSYNKTYNHGVVPFFAVPSVS